jgi:integrase/recombinase XerD
MSVLGQALEDYLRLRRALGFKLQRHGRLLPSLVSHLEPAGAATVTTQLALAWATAVEGKPGEWAIRLSIARGFAAYLQSLDPATEVPPAGLLPRTRRRASPYLYTEAETAALMNATATLRFPLNRATYKTVIGLLAATGMRIGELIALDRDDLDRDERTLLVRNAKFADTRLPPLHNSTTGALGAYAGLRDELCPQPAPGRSSSPPPAPVWLTRTSTQPSGTWCEPPACSLARSAATRGFTTSGIRRTAGLCALP